MNAPTLAAQQAAADALAHIFRNFGHLPAADIQLGTVYLDQVRISVHDGLGDFETWREALGLSAEEVEHRELPSSMSLAVSGAYAGAAVQLIGFGPLLALTETGTP